jgi:two-component system, NarL family, sensor histidine kinase DesK
MIVLKSELAGPLVRDAPTRAAAEIAEIERAARDALREVRAAVAGYRQPSLRSELAAARELLSAAGIASDIEHSGGSVPPAVDGLLAWAVREGVTNVIRHSRARSCTIRVGRMDAEVKVEVSDDGRGADADGRAGGSGLAGLAERAASQGGRVVAGPRPGGGFRLVMEASLSGTDGDRQR